MIKKLVRNKRSTLKAFFFSFEEETTAIMSNGIFFSPRRFCSLVFPILLLLLFKTDEKFSVDAKSLPSLPFSVLNNHKSIVPPTTSASTRILARRRSSSSRIQEEQQQQQQEAAWLSGVKNSLASALAAASSKIILAPFDTIKTLQQYSRSSMSNNPLTLAEATRVILKRPKGFLELYVSKKTA